MKVKVLFFASLREQVGVSQETLELPAAVDTVDKLRSHLRLRGGAFGKAFDDKALVRSAVNQAMVKGEAAVRAGDEVAFFPPVTGG